MNDKILSQLLDTLRNDPASQSDKVIVSLALLVWCKKSFNTEVPDNLKITNCRGIDLVKLRNVLNEIGLMGQCAFLDDEEVCSKITKIGYETISVAINQCISIGELGILDNYNPTDAALAIRSKTEFSLPKEVADLLVGLAGNLSNKNVYLPLESGGQITGRVLNNDAIVHIESPFSSYLPKLIATLLGKDCIETKQNDFLRTPTYIEEGRLKQFSTTIAPLPFNVNVAKDIFDQDLFGRFKEKTRSLTVLAIRHILSQTQGRAIITMANSLLFSSGAERELRDDLLKNKKIEAVIAMPVGLFDTTAIAFSILILNTDRKNESVRFINADTDKFRVAVSRTRNQLVNVESLIDIILSDSKAEFTCNVPTATIISNDSQLQVNRYVRTDKERYIDEKLSRMERRPLDRISILIKPMASMVSKEGQPAFEVGATDIPENGYIHTASKPLFVTAKNRKAIEQFLRPNDIVLIVKGSVGKVGIIPKDIPESTWLAGQSSAVIRLHEDSDIDPRALFMMLRSNLGNELLKKLVSGAAIPFIQLRELQTLNIPIPSSRESSNAIEILEEEEKIQQEIVYLKQRQSELRMECWELKQ